MPDSRDGDLAAPDLVDAERIDCVLVTADLRLASAPGIGCPVEVLRA